MPDTFVPTLAPNVARNIEGFHAVHPAPVAAPDVRRFQMSDAAGSVTLAARPTFDLDGGAAIPTALVHAAREQACEDGYAAGHAAGLAAAAQATAHDRAAATAAREQAAAAAAAEVAQAVRALQAAARRLEAETVALASDVGEQTIEAVTALATAVLGHALAAGEDSPLAAARRALEPLPGDGPVVLTLSPQDADVIRLAMASDGPTDLDHLGAGREVTVVADPRLQRGDAVATSGVTEVDARLDAAWQRALAALRS